MLRVTKPSFVVVLIAVLSLSGISQQRRVSSVIDENLVRAHIKFLSSDLLEGRGTGAPGGEIAAHYIAAQLEAISLKGAGPGGSFFQPVSLVGVKADPKTTLSVVRTSNGSWRFDIARSVADKTPFLKFRSWMTDDASRRMVKLAGKDLAQLRHDPASRDFHPVDLNLKGSLRK